MTNRGNGSGVVEDIWMNTQVGIDDFDRIEHNGPNSPANWEEVEEANILLNPDPFSMEGRG